MPALVILAILALPFVEIAVFIRVGEWLGVWPTIGLTLLSTIVGINLMRMQGLITIARAREAIARNEPPVDEMLDGLCILLAGALLIVPGFVTDVLGLLLFIPWVRHQFRTNIWRTFETQDRRWRGTVIETDFVVIDEDTKKNLDDDKPTSDERPKPKRLGNGDAP